MALFRPELWVQSGFPSTYSGTFLVKAYITSDAGASTQVLISRNWSSANEGIVLYWDNSADAMTVAWFTGGGATADFTNFASRPAIGVPFVCFLRNTATGVEAGWAPLTNPDAWVLASTATAIPSVGTDNAINLTSNANGALGVYEGWLGWSDQKTNAQLSLEVYDTAINRTNLIFEHSLNDGDVTSPWVDTSGQGNNATQQGGLAPTDSPNFLAKISVAKQQVGVRTPQILTRDRILRQRKNDLWFIDPKNWGPLPLDVAKWFSKELTTPSGATGPTGTLNKTENPDTSGATGTTTIVGTLARTNQNDTSAAAGTPILVGTLAKTNQNDTLSAAGATTIVGTLNRTNGDDTLNASGTVGSPVSGSLSRQEQSDTLSASGTTTIVSSLARTNGNDTISASGTTTVTGSLSRTNSDDTLNASGTVGSPVSGSLNVGEQRDTISANGNTTVVGSLSRTNGNDTVVATGSTTVVGAMSRSEIGDIMTASGSAGTPVVGTRFWRWLGLTLERMGL